MAGFSFKSGSMGNRDLKPLYIILVPVILLLVVLNSGYVQKWLTAASIQNHNYTAVDYDYYYFSEYIDFLNANADRLEELGFDNKTSESKQTYEGELTWRDHFIELADRRLQETAYYNGLALVDGYEFTAEDLAPIEETMDFFEEDRALNSLSLQNYLVAYYGAGTTEESFRENLSDYVKGQAYKSYLAKQWSVSDAEISSYLSAHPETESYPSANARIILMKAVNNRTTGMVEERELSALSNKISELKNYYEKDASSFTMLASEFCEDSELLKDGCICKNLQKGSLPEELEDWLFASARKAGEVSTYVDESTGYGYFVIYDGAGEDASRMIAKETLIQQAMDAAFAEACEGPYMISKNSIGMKFVGK